MDNNLATFDPQAEHIMDIFQCPFPDAESRYPLALYSSGIPRGRLPLKHSLLAYAMAGMVGAFIGQYIGNIALNIFMDRPPNEILRITRPIPVYYATTLAGGIVGVLSVYLPRDLLIIAAVIVYAAFIDAFLKISGYEGTLTGAEFTFVIIRNILSLLVIYRFIDVLIYRGNPPEGEPDNLLMDAFITSAWIKVLFAFNDYFISFERVRALLCSNK